MKTISTMVLLSVLAVVMIGCSQQNTAGQATGVVPIGGGSISYLDPTDCVFNISTPTNDVTTVVSCGPGRVISSVTHVFCPSNQYVPRIDGSTWYTGQTPILLQYTCYNPVNWTARTLAPSQVFFYCCAIKTYSRGGVVAAKEAVGTPYKSEVKEGKVTVTPGRE